MADRIPGSSWSNPIWHRGYRIYVSNDSPFNYAYVHDDFDGADDSKDDRHGYATTVDEAKAEIDEKEGVTPLTQSTKAGD